MKKINFLTSLVKQKKLELVEVSDVIKEAYLQRAEESLLSAKTLLKVGNLKDAVALAYYAMYHSLLALFFRCGIKCENHTAAIILLREVFEIDNAAISKAKEERVDKQYYVDFNVTKEEVMQAITIAEIFIAELYSFISILTEEKIRSYREILKTRYLL